MDKKVIMKVVEINENQPTASLFEIPAGIAL